jgi:hypothetical protein
MSSEHLLLKLQQLDHQAGQRLVGGGLRLDVLRDKRERGFTWKYQDKYTL